MIEVDIFIKTVLNVNEAKGSFYIHEKKTVTGYLEIFNCMDIFALKLNFFSFVLNLNCRRLKCPINQANGILCQREINVEDFFKKFFGLLN